MKFTPLALPGVWLVEPEIHVDERGVFRRHYCAREYIEHGLETTVAQGNLSENPQQFTLRGFHYQQTPHGEAKTLSCITGAIYDIVVDVRRNSPNFMRWIHIELSAAGRQSLFVPRGFANAWLTLQPDTVVHYYVSEYFAPEADRGFRYNDPAFGFEWPAAPAVISDKDRSFADFDPATSGVLGL